MRGCLKTCLLLGLIAAAIADSKVAEAGFQLALTAGGVSQTFVDSDEDNEILVDNVVINGVKFKLHMASSNTPGENSMAFVTSESNVIESLVAGPIDVRIVASANDFIAPVTPPDLEAVSNGTGTILGGTPSNNSAVVGFNAYVDQSNNLAPALGGSIGGTVVGSGGPSAIVARGGSVAWTDSELIPYLAPPYAITLELFATITGQNTKLSLDGGVDIVPTPEPATLAIWSVLGLVGTVAAVRRRRRQ